MSWRGKAGGPGLCVPCPGKAGGPGLCVSWRGKDNSLGTRATSSMYRFGLCSSIVSNILSMSACFRVLRVCKFSHLRARQDAQDAHKQGPPRRTQTGVLRVCKFSHLAELAKTHKTHTNRSSASHTNRSSASHTNRVLRVCKFSHLAELARCQDLGCFGGAREEI